MPESLAIRNDIERAAVANLIDHLRALVDFMGSELPSWLHDYTTGQWIEDLERSLIDYDRSDPNPAGY